MTCSLPTSGRGQQDVSRHPGLRPLIATATPGDAGRGHSALPPSADPRLRNQPHCWFQEGGCHGNQSTVTVCSIHCVHVCVCMCVCVQAISCHYASSHCDYVPVDGTTQENIAEEVMELVRRRLGPDAKITFQVPLSQPTVHAAHGYWLYMLCCAQDTWRLRGLCVKGQRVNL